DNDPFFGARTLHERLRVFSENFEDLKSPPPMVSYHLSFGRFSTPYKIPADKLSPLFQAKAFGSKAVEIRRKLFKENHLVPFFTKDHEIITDLIDYADEVGREKVNEGCHLFLNWINMSELSKNNCIYNISYASCVNKKG